MQKVFVAESQFSVVEEKKLNLKKEEK